MTIAYGVTPQGFVRKPLDVITSDLNAQLQASVDPELDLTPNGAIGVAVSSLAAKLDELWGLAETIYNGGDPDQSVGPMLVALSSLTGTIPTQPSPSVVTCAMVLNASASVPAGTLANVANEPTNLWTLIGPPDPTTGIAVPGPVASTTAGTYLGVFASTTNGPNVAPSGTLTVITAPVSGLTAVTNPLDAALGTAGYTGTPADDAVLRQQREAELAASGSSTVDSLQAALDEITGVISARVFQNTSTAFDPTTGLPPKSYMALVWDGVSPPDDDDAIAQAVWNGKPSGMQAWGTSTGVAVDARGANQVMPFSRVAQLHLYMVATCTLGTSFPSGGITALKAQLAAFAQELLTPGQEAVALALRSSLLTSSNPSENVAGVIDVPAFALGTSPSPTFTGNLTPAFNQVFVPDTSRILINGV